MGEVLLTSAWAWGWGRSQLPGHAGRRGRCVNHRRGAAHTLATLSKSIGTAASSQLEGLSSSAGSARCRLTSQACATGADQLAAWGITARQASAGEARPLIAVAHVARA